MRLEFNELNNGDVKANLVPRGNNGIMNNHNRVLLQNWRANVDINFLLDWENTVRYMVKNVSKQEKRNQSILDLFSSPPCAETTTMTPSVQKPDHANYFQRPWGGETLLRRI